jgi:hypothetical protein
MWVGTRIGAGFGAHIEFLPLRGTIDNALLVIVDPIAIGTRTQTRTSALEFELGTGAL